MDYPDEDREYVVAQVLSRHAVQSVPESLDLWPTLQSRIETRHVQTAHGTKEGARFFAFGKHPLILRVGTSLALLAIILLPIAVPKVQAALREQLQRFGVLLISATPNPTEGTIVGASARLLLPVNVTAAQRQVPFHIYQPAWVPTGYTSRGAIVAPATGVQDRFSAPKVFRVDIAYGPPEGSSGGFHIQQTPVGGAANYAFPLNTAQQTQVNGRPAVYIRGAWQTGEQWNDAADSGVLS